MYLDFEEGKKKAKDGAIIWKTFGVIAAIFLILFFICGGIAKTIMGIFCGLNIAFILVTFCIGFVQRGDKNTNEEIKNRVQKDVDDYQRICMNPENKDFLTELSTWYLLWSNGKQEKNTSDKLMHLGLNLQTCKHDGNGVFAELIDLFHRGVEIQKADKIAVIDAGLKLTDALKDSERSTYKEKIVSIVSKYC